MADVRHALFFILAFGALFLLAMALEAGYGYWRGRRHVYHRRETLANIRTGVSYKVVDGIAIALFIQVLYEWVAGFGLQWYPAPGVLSILLLCLLVDFCFYVNHYLMHKVRWLWASHVTHHSSGHMNLSTALRQNFSHALNGAWVLWWLPAALVGFDKNWVLIAIEANLVYQFFLHTEQVGQLGWLERIFNTPSHHRVHHGRNPRQIDTNFGGVLIIWDRLFGTFRREQDAGTIQYGIPRMPARPYAAWHLQTHEWLSLWRDLRRWKDWRILVKAPDWARSHYAGIRPTADPAAAPPKSPPPPRPPAHSR
ncbi:MAG: sterol desaturase family protein [Pseudomonadota bacterium]|nr:sterol desaturase [Pseudomonadales bacterium]MDY6918829.1 sterol desaturase family protein [Pseudomonadota bacterium]